MRDAWLTSCYDCDARSKPHTKLIVNSRPTDYLTDVLGTIFLLENGLLSKPVFYLSAYLEAHRETYYDRLRAISREDDWNGWISFFLVALVEQARSNTEKTRSILALHDHMKREIPRITRSQYAVQTIDALFYRPIFQSNDFLRRSHIPRDSALRILSEMKKNGIITDLRPRSGRRAAVMIFPELMRITEA